MESSTPFAAPARDHEIIQAFSMPETLDAISDRLGCGRSTVQRVWKSAQATGLLPPRRPHFAAASGALKETDADLDFETMTDQEYEAYQHREDEIERHRRAANVASCDALLAALISAHGRPRKLSNGAILPPLGLDPDLREVRA